MPTLMGLPYLGTVAGGRDIGEIVCRNRTIKPGTVESQRNESPMGVAGSPDGF
jgi:hypothetical protein